MKKAPETEEIVLGGQSKEGRADKVERMDRYPFELREEVLGRPGPLSAPN